MRRALALVAVALVAGGCGSAKDRQRQQLNAYVTRVNRIETKAQAAWGRASLAYARLARGRLTPKELRGLAASPRTIRAVRRQIAAVEPPPVARRLHARLLRLLGRDAAFADEVSVFGRYIRAVTPLEQAVGAETAVLRRDLKTAHGRRREEAVLASYAARIGAVERALHALRPPAVLAPWHAEQLHRAALLRRSALELRTGLVHRDAKEELRGLDGLRAGVVRPAVTQADRTAIEDYDRRLAQIRSLAGEIAQLQRQLTRKLA